MRNAPPRQGCPGYTDEYVGYRGLPFRHRTVRRKAGEYVSPEGASTNCVESFWAVLKRGYHGTFHSVSRKHLDRYVYEFTVRHNARGLDAVDQIAALAQGMVGKRLTYRDLVA